MCYFTFQFRGFSLTIFVNFASISKFRLHAEISWRKVRYTDTFRPPRNRDLHDLDFEARNFAYTTKFRGEMCPTLTHFVIRKITYPAIFRDEIWPTWSDFGLEIASTRDNFEEIFKVDFRPWKSQNAQERCFLVKSVKNGSKTTHR